MHELGEVRAEALCDERARRARRSRRTRRAPGRREARRRRRARRRCRGCAADPAAPRSRRTRPSWRRRPRRSCSGASFHDAGRETQSMRVLQHAGHRAVVLRRDQEERVGLVDASRGGPDGRRRLHRVLVEVLVVVGEDAEPVDRARPRPLRGASSAAARARAELYDPARGCRRWRGSAPHADLDRREVGLEDDLVREQEAAARKRCVPLEAEVGAVDRRLELEADAVVAPRVGACADVAARRARRAS